MELEGVMGIPENEHRTARVTGLAQVSALKPLPGPAIESRARKIHRLQVCLKGGI